MSDFVLDHAMLRVGDLEASLAWYETHLDYVEHARWEGETFTNVYLGPADPTRRARSSNSRTTTTPTSTIWATRSATSPCARRTSTTPTSN